MLISNDIVSRVRELLSEMKEADLKHQLREAKEDLKGNLTNQLHNVQTELTLQIDHAKEGVTQRLDTVNPDQKEQLLLPTALGNQRYSCRSTLSFEAIPYPDG